jgi:hypothetical protein
MAKKKADRVVWKGDIEKLFTKTDIDHMSTFGVMLDSYTYCKVHYPMILARILDDSMPPGNPWKPEWKDRFQKWQQGGFLES